jgi:beta-glucanase (GH16 family)
MPGASIPPQFPHNSGREASRAGPDGYSAASNSTLTWIIMVTREIQSVPRGILEKGSRGSDPSSADVARVSPRRRLIRFVIAGTTLAAILAVGVQFITPTAKSNPASGMSLAFSPTFRGTGLDTVQWATCYSWADPQEGCTNYGNAVRDAWYLPSGDVVADGTLHLVATRTPTPGATQKGAPESYPYTSGMVTTKNSFDFTYGYVQVVARIPGGTGTWPALWLLPQSGVWPPEIDIMENWGSPTGIQTTYIWSASGSVQQAHVTSTSPTNLTSGYHTYGLLWQPGSLTWYLDGRMVDTYKGANVPSQPMYFLANLAIDGRATSGSSFDIKSVKIYK